jgi:hypothetical protein
MPRALFFWIHLLMTDLDESFPAKSKANVNESIEVLFTNHKR